MDPDCAICHAMCEAIDNLTRIGDYIMLSKPKSKKDFGLHKSFVDKQIATIMQMQKFHDYYHSTGEALNDSGSGLDSFMGGGNYSPPEKRPRRFRPS